MPHLGEWELIASNEELDYLPHDRADAWDEVDEFGQADADGATLSRADFEDARAGM